MTAAFNWSSFSAHPLTLLLVGALLSGVGAPWLTRRWQVRQRKLELKTELIREVSDHVTSVVRFVQFMDAGAKDPRERKRAEDRLGFWIADWERGTTLIWTRLRAYFRRPDLAHKWIRYTDALRHLYNFTWVGTRYDWTCSARQWRSKRQAQLEGLATRIKELGDWDEGLPWDLLLDVKNRLQFMERWDEMQRIFLAPLPELVRGILRSRMVISAK